MMAVQFEGAPPNTAWDLVAISSAETKAVLVVLAVFSLISWFLIAFKWWQLRRVRQQGNHFFGALEQSRSLEEAHTTAQNLPPSPFGRVLREGIQFFQALRPSGETQPSEESTSTLSVTQLEALRMVLAKEVSAERDLMARFIPWLATIGAVSPLLGLLGTVLGVMDSFIGIATGGSGNISAVAPGVAEALITTVVGLAVAIPAVIAYNLLANRLGVYAGELEGFAHEVIGSMAREGRL